MLYPACVHAIYPTRTEKQRKHLAENTNSRPRAKSFQRTRSKKPTKVGSADTGRNLQNFGKIDFARFGPFLAILAIGSVTAALAQKFRVVCTSWCWKLTYLAQNVIFYNFSHRTRFFYHSWKTFFGQKTALEQSTPIENRCKWLRINTRNFFEKIGFW